MTRMIEPLEIKIIMTINAWKTNKLVDQIQNWICTAFLYKEADKEILGDLSQILTKVVNFK